jgi:hypothetical protein
MVMNLGADAAAKNAVQSKFGVSVCRSVTGVRLYVR